jgi:hypothetical protein
VYVITDSRITFDRLSLWIKCYNPRAISYSLYFGNKKGTHLVEVNDDEKLCKQLELLKNSSVWRLIVKVFKVRNKTPEKVPVLSQA